MRNRLLGMLVVVTLASCDEGLVGRAAGLPLRCSLVALLANPSDYDGVLIQTVGYATSKSGTPMLYLSKIDAENGVSLNGISLALDASEENRDRPDLLDQQYLLVEGVFDADNRGHLGMAGGSIEQIRKLGRLDLDSEPQTEGQNTTPAP